MNAHKECIVVSGGSRGLGLAIVEACLARGAAVASFARRRTSEIQAVAEKHGDAFLFQERDSLDSASLKDFLKTAMERFERIAGLVNNAAIGQDHLLANMSEDDIDKVVLLNLTATIKLSRLVLKHMLLSGAGGQIINVSSICGMRGYPGLSVYSATKGGLDAFTRSLAREVGERGILVNSIAPGFFSSEMSAVLSEEQLQVIRRRTPTNELTEINHVIATLMFLLFEAKNITGQTIAVDGGASV